VTSHDYRLTIGMADASANGVYARCAESNRVLYVEPSFSMARSSATHLREVATNRWLLPRLESRTLCAISLEATAGFTKMDTTTHPHTQLPVVCVPDPGGPAAP
jgi:hypothetical protein